ncbi:MAG: paraquat-inducible protein A [Lentisphaeria bacterium]|nr:paraquat-inducible protein A [Lentisphaeria bacterium]
MSDDKTTFKRACDHGYLRCETCESVYKQDDCPDECDFCGSPIHQRKPENIARAWAFLIAAAVFVIPANIYPISIFEALGNKSPGTIMDSVIYFFDEGMYGIAIIIGTASILIPIAKLICLAYLIYTAQFGKRSRLRHRTILFRGVEKIGRWSMLDIFVVALLSSLVQLGSLAIIFPGAAATSFCMVVILTVFAAESFDARVMWDQGLKNEINGGKNAER